MQIAALCNEELQNWDRAEELVKQMSQRFRDSTFDWFFWCRRTGRGDAKAAQQHAQQFLNSNGEDLPADLLDEAGVYFILEDQPAAALAAFKRAFDNDETNLYAAMQAASLADQLSRPAERNTLLAAIVDAERSYDEDEIYVPYVRLAGLFRRYLSGGRSALESSSLDEVLQLVDARERKELDDFVESEKAVKELMQPDGRTYVDYFVGSFLRLRGDAAAADTYLKRCAQSPNKHIITCTLANDYLRRHAAAEPEKP
jgi:hypothetical protein